MKYRADIDGLRAVAVLTVILFHFGIPGFGGGFIGVDIFFVLSGYLIGSIILKQLNEERFSFTQFYFRRIRRLMPVFTVVMVVSFGLAYWLMLPADFREFGQSLATSTVYLSNFLFYREAGYFDTASHLKPLLHTWSLSVEEQFYIVFPFLAWFIFRVSRKWWTVTFAILTVLSLAASIVYLPKDASAVFYLYPFRAWEMFLGVLLAAGSLPMIRRSSIINLLALVGSSLILVPTFLYTTQTPFPGLAALFPCLGTIIIIYCGNASNSIINKWLTNPVLVFIGKISYSLYLWHWPFYVFYVYYKVDFLTAIDIVLLLVATFGAAILSWRFIEIPFREGRAIFSKKAFSVFTATAAASALLVGIGFYLHFSQGMPQRFSKEAVQFADAAGDLFGDLTGCVNIGNTTLPELGFCEIDNALDAKKYTLIWSDSHGAAYKSGYELANVDKREPALLAWTGGCPPVFGVDKDESAFSQAFNEQCKFRNTAIEKLLLTDKRIDKLVLLGRWSYYYAGQGVGVDDHNTIRLWPVGSENQVEDQSLFFLESIQRTVEQLNEIGFKPYIVQQPPEFPRYLSEQVAFGFIRNKPEIMDNLEQLTTVTYSEVIARQGEINKLLEKLASENKIHLIKTHQFFCSQKACSLMIDGKPTYFDNNHVSTYGARKMSAMFNPLLNNN
ncbi:MAG: peptidoglycan/LPS O-acetylase OafA/YrhL [Alphaproteobacteria bacterium]|jgi:peptidoglycan/LPS O-acetylase OafA/YrhL